MTTSRKVVKVFLASPGDLQNERKAAKAKVDEFNALWADRLGYHVELVGWEETVSSWGRPQTLINNDLEQCELFVGMVWKKWGTPPAGDGPYSSGFEEEFRTSVERRRDHGRPEISLYLKEIGTEILSDPGEQLRKVLTFADEIRSSKEILYEQFSDCSDFESKFFRRITRYVQGLKDAEAKRIESAEQQLPRQTSGSIDPGSESARTIEASDSLPLKRILSSIQNHSSQEFDAVDVARFRLLGTIIQRQGNDTETLGTHDANIIYLNRLSADLTWREASGLIEAALHRFQQEVVPLWCWLKQVDGFSRGLLAIYTTYGATQRRSGALNAMRLIGATVPDLPGLPRQDLIASWFGDGTESGVRIAALNYLAEHGRTADLEVISEELSKTDRNTSGAAIDAIIRINLRQSTGKAVEALFAHQPDSVDDDLLGRIFNAKNPLSLGALEPGLRHKSSGVRRAVAKLLRKRDQLTPELAEQLLKDDDRFTRAQGAFLLMKRGRFFSADELKKLSAKPSSQTRGLFGLFTPAGQLDGKLSERLEYYNLHCLPDSDLEKLRQNSLDESAYFVLAERHFGRYKNDLRSAIDDEFKGTFSSILEKLSTNLGADSEPVAAFRALDESLRSRWLKAASDVICRRGGVEDLLRVRRLLAEQKIECTEAVLDFLKQQGEFEDIATIVEAYNRRSGELWPLLIDTRDGDEDYKVAATLFALGRTQFGILINLKDIRARLLVRIISHASRATFRGLSTQDFLALLRHGDAQVRRAAALKVGQTLSQKLILKLLRDYMQGRESQYYNVLHWLDLSISAPRTSSVRAISTSLEKMAPTNDTVLDLD